MNVLISGYYGFGNLGDEAVLSGLATGLQAHGHSVSVLSSNPEKTRALHGVEAVTRYKGLLPALVQCDAVISGGGGLLQDKTSARSLRYYLGILRLAKTLGKRAVVYGQSVGPLSPAGKRTVRRTLTGIPVAVRDGASQRLLASLGVTAELVADAALLLPEPKGTTTMSLTPPVLLIPRGGYPEITEALIALAKALRVKGVPLAGMGVQPGQDDAPLKRLKEAVPELALWRADTPSAAISTVAGATHVVSARLHGLVFAGVAQRPFSGIVYDPKVAAFAQEAGAGAYYVPLELDKVVEAVTTPTLDVDTSNIDALKVRAAQGLLWLDEVLRQGRAR